MATRQPLDVTRLLQVVMAVITALGSILLGMGERQIQLPLLAVFVSALSVYVTDWKRIVHLTPAVSNAAGVLAIILALWDLDRFESDSRLLALANLLIYLQFVLLFQFKTPRIYWQLFVLSFLQVAVASALNFSPLYGLLMFVYLVITLAGFSLFYLYREQLRFGLLRPAAMAADVGQPSHNGSAAGSDTAPAIAPSASQAVRWPWLDSPPAYPRGDYDFSLLSRKGSYWMQIGQLGILSVLFAAVLFFVLPRREGTRWDPAEGNSSFQIGAADTVRLGEIGSLTASTEAAMTAAFVDHRTGDEYRLLDEPYFRGVVLDIYADNSWRRYGDEDESPTPLPVNSEAEIPWFGDIVRQRINIEPLDTDAIFAVYPFYNLQFQKNLLWQSDSRRLMRPASVMGSRFEFQLITTSLVNGRQFEIQPASWLRENRRLSILTALGPNLPNVREIATQVLENIPREDTAARARALCNYLRFSGRYGYSLDLSRKDPSIDPIEDFLRNTRQGHCEYFASALTLMLRSAGIPARLVIGFRGGDYNRFGGFYQVRQLHAHAWVEAYLPVDQLPEELPAPKGQWRSGGWLRLDPTPAGPREQRAPTMSVTLAILRQSRDFVRYLWTNYVLGLDSQRQYAAIYGPLITGAKEVIATITSRAAWQELFRQVSRIFRIDPSGWLGGEWFNWRAGLASSLFCLAIIAAVRGTRSIGRRYWGWGEDESQLTPAAAGPEVAFYRQLEDLLRPWGLTRGATQTQREFARRAASEVERLAPGRRLGRIPLEIADAFYRIRFGNRPLDNDEQWQVELGVSQLAHALELAAAQQAAQPS